MSIHTAQTATITHLPLAAIHRPIPPVLDQEKIGAMVCTLEDPATPLPPIDVFHIRSEGVDHYYAFGGCHRFQAYERAGAELVPCKVVRAAPSTLKLYMGASAPDFSGHNH